MSAVVLASRLGGRDSDGVDVGARHPEPDWRMARRLAEVLAVPTERVFSVLGLDRPQHLHNTQNDRLDVCSPDFLRELRRWNGLTQQELARRLGVGRATVADWERARHRPCQQAQQTLVTVLQGGSRPRP